MGEYLIQRLPACGVEHVFGVPGDHFLGMWRCTALDRSKRCKAFREDQHSDCLHVARQFS
ncbi:MAG TPA: thiamine pyrophosphate-binding protein [Verrucomicrobiae bacterium]|nr:thiamine pyrophosphate-binding protein [Verrucomicrobiae bacterium]